MPTCKQCGEEADALVTVKVAGFQPASALRAPYAYTRFPRTTRVSFAIRLASESKPQLAIPTNVREPTAPRSSAPPADFEDEPTKV